MSKKKKSLVGKNRSYSYEEIIKDFFPKQWAKRNEICIYCGGKKKCKEIVISEQDILDLIHSIGSVK